MPNASRITEELWHLAADAHTSAVQSGHQATIEKTAELTSRLIDYDDSVRAAVTLTRRGFTEDVRKQLDQIDERRSWERGRRGIRIA